MVAALADVLGLDRFAVWGYSGGGPYAAACAAELADRVSSTMVAAGMGQVGVWATVDDFEHTDRQFLQLAVRRPRLARLLLGVAGRAARWSPKAGWKGFARQLPPSDRAVLETVAGDWRQAMAVFTQAFLHGARGVVDDDAALARPWGVDVARAGTTVRLFHGDDEPMVPLQHSRALAERIPGAELTVWPREGHLATIVHVDAVLDALTDGRRSLSRQPGRAGPGLAPTPRG
jgi:pimeloyl-ACP methyl ester carboxylesterase